ncbi:very short patch repair endonuclease [Herbaspirillum sp. RV1423]|uniref:very short patch repair endonuclease n=1 Tax=Herbaspirillum sp. RV1423 TaxID=1443993 RepID=UPI001E3B7A34|nr:DNA mismatch endonuclease Vsr [Herbaspirillum sp. RV1423]
MMVDVFSKAQRSAIMARIKAKNTKPEMVVRRIVHGLGYRYRLHRPDLPGKPDLTFPRFQKVIFVHGCFWHHHLCQRGRLPSSNISYWAQKIQSNVLRDRRYLCELRMQGWKPLVIWECQLKERDKLVRRIKRFLERA